MNGRKFIFLTDLALMLAFVPTFWTGVEGHLMRHDHGLWHDRMVLHTVAGLLFTAAAIVHLWSHRGWYRGLAATGCGGRKRAVLLLSLVFLATVGPGVSLLAFADGDIPLCGGCRSGIPVAFPPAAADADFPQRSGRAVRPAER